MATFHNEARSLYRNDGDAQFTDIGYRAGLGQAALPYVAFGAKFADFDNDGRLDLLVANGHVQDNIEKIENTTYRQPTQLFHNRGDAPVFEEATARAGPDLLRPIVGRGLAVGDYDNDGKVDALVVDSEGKPLLLRNETGGGGHWIGFRVEQSGTGRNRGGFGALVRVETDAGRQMRQCQTGGSYLSASDARVHFGLGAAGTVRRVTVVWPDGAEETWTGDLPTDRYLTLARGKRPR